MPQDGSRSLVPTFNSGANEQGYDKPQTVNYNKYNQLIDKEWVEKAENLIITNAGDNSIKQDDNAQQSARNRTPRGRRNSLGFALEVGKNIKKLTISPDSSNKTDFLFAHYNISGVLKESELEVLVFENLVSENKINVSQIFGIVNHASMITSKTLKRVEFNNCTFEKDDIEAFIDKAKTAEAGPKLESISFSRCRADELAEDLVKLLDDGNIDIKREQERREQEKQDKRKKEEVQPDTTPMPQETDQTAQSNTANTVPEGQQEEEAQSSATSMPQETDQTEQPDTANTVPEGQQEDQTWISWAKELVDNGVKFITGYSSLDEDQEKSKTGSPSSTFVPTGWEWLCCSGRDKSGEEGKGR